MALFNKEPEKGPKIQPVQPATASNSQPQPTAASATANPSASTAPSSASSAPRPASAEGRAYLDRGSKISGKLSFEGPIRIDGEVDGEIIGKDVIQIGESAVVTAQIKAASVVVSGKVSGDIVGTQRIEIRTSAKVTGNLSSPVLVIQEGALFEGHCSMQPEGARDDRKVTVFPKEERVAPKEERIPQAASGGQKQA